MSMRTAARNISFNRGAEDSNLFPRQAGRQQVICHKKFRFGDARAVI
jgi:hypothetical protein